MDALNPFLRGDLETSLPEIDHAPAIVAAYCLRVNVFRVARRREREGLDSTAFARTSAAALPAAD